MNIFRVGLIETLHLLGAACERQAAREASLRRGRTGGAKLQISRLPWRALAPFALCGPPEAVPETAGDMNPERRADARAPGE